MLAVAMFPHPSKERQESVCVLNPLHVLIVSPACLGGGIPFHPKCFTIRNVVWSGSWACPVEEAL